MDAQQAAIYFQANPDVAAEFARDNAGMSPEQFASWHYANNGWKEQRALPQVVNARDYFAANPDVAAAYAQGGQGMTPDEFAQAHYDQYVATGKEKRNVALAPAPRSGYNPDGSQRTSANPNNVAPDVQVVGPSGTGIISGAQAAADADPGAAYRAQRQAEADAALAPQRALEGWQAQIEAQPWYKDFTRALGPRQAFGGGESNWGYNSRTGQFTNAWNQLIDQYGTVDPREYAAANGLPPPPEAGWQSDPTKWQRDLRPEPTRSPYQQDIANRQAANAATAGRPLSQRRPATLQPPAAPLQYGTPIPEGGPKGIDDGSLQRVPPNPSAAGVAPPAPKPLISAARMPATVKSSPTTSPGAVSSAIGPSNPATVAPARSFEMPRQPQSRVQTTRNGLVGNWMRRG